MSDTKKVRLAFFHTVCPDYNIPMFKKIQNLPSISFTLFVGDKSLPMAPRSGDYSEINHVQLTNKILNFFGFTILWQNFLKKFNPKKYDAVILSEGVLFISNYLIILICKIYGLKFGFYSHGFNHQRENSAISKILEFFRGFLHRRADFVIVYSEKGLKHVNKVNKVPKEKIFIAKNTLDIEDISKRSINFSNQDISDFRNSMGIENEDFVICYLGRIVKEKNPIWVAEAIDYLNKNNLSCHAMFIGEGSEQSNVQRYTEKLNKDIRKKIHFFGHIDFEKVDFYLKSANISVMPGMTGLAIVHSFALGKPYITIDISSHSPEIDYLINNKNGLIVKNNKQSFFEAIESLIRNKDLYKQLVRGAEKYAIEELSSKKQIQAFTELSILIQKSKENT